MKQLIVTRVFHELWSSQNRINALRGGARSSKTYSTLQAIAIWLVSGKFGSRDFQKGSFSVVRETLPSLKASAYKDFIQILHDLGYYTQVDHRKTVLEFAYLSRVVRFFSTDDLNSAKLRGQQHTFFYMNEANSITFEAFNQLIMRTEQFCILDYNPAGDMDNWVRTNIEGERMKRGDVKLIVSTYKDNEHNLSPEIVKEIQGLKHTDRDLYEVYTRGNWVQSRNLVFDKIYTCSSMPQEYEEEYFGLDFGYNDPTVCIRVIKIENNLFIESLFYRSQMLIDQIAGELQVLNSKVYCDHEPRTIRKLRSKGIRAVRASKGHDSISEGLDYIRSHKIHILSSCIDVLKEYRSYKYKLDKEGKATDTPLDYNNHSIDATRYALSNAMRKKLIVL